MAQIHKKAPLKKKRMTEFHAKKKTIGQKIAAGIRGYGPAVIGGLKKMGSELKKPETQQRLGDFGRRMGAASRNMFSGYGYSEPRRKKRKSKR